MTLGLSPVPQQRMNNIVIPQDRPVYKIKEGKFFGPDDRLYNEGEIIAYEDEPNLEMEPLNTLAENNMRAFLTKLDNAGRKVAETAGKAYTSLADAFENARALEQTQAKKVQLLSAKEQVPLMGAKKKNTNISKVDIDTAVPAMGAVNTPTKTPVQSNAADKNSGKAELNKSTDI